MSTEDLLEHFKLPAEVFPEYTLQVTYKRNRTRRVREKVEEKWMPMEIVGEGAFGMVRKELCTLEDGHESVRAVKIIEKRKMAMFNIDFKKELLALSKFSKDEHQQAEVLVSFFGWFESDQHIFLAMEYFENGDLAQHLANIRTEDEVRQITTDLLDGLQIIHSEGFAHRDLKPQNIFVVQKPPQTARWWVKIGDFGISKRVTNEETAFRTQTGTPYFQAPEIQGFVDEDAETSVYDNSVDIWSLGCVIFNISAQRVPFLKPAEVRRFCQGQSPFPEELLYQKMTDDGIRFVKRLLVSQPAQRVSVANALTDPWILLNSSAGRQSPKPPTSSEVQEAASASSKPNGDETSVLSIRNARKSSPAIEEIKPGQEPPAAYYTVVDSNNTVANLPKLELQRTINHRGPVLRLAFSPDSKLLATIFLARCAEIQVSSLDSDSKIKKRILKNQGGDVNAIAFSPNSKLLASSYDDKTVILWIAETGAVWGRLGGHHRAVYAIDFSPDGNLLASASSDSTVILWDTATAAVEKRIQGDETGDIFVRFSPNGKLLAWSGGTTVRLYILATGGWQTLEGHTLRIYRIAFSPDGKLLASSSIDGTVRLWNVATGVAWKTIEGRENMVSQLSFSPDGKLLAFASVHGTITLCNTATGSVWQMLDLHWNRVQRIAFSWDSRLLASTSEDGKVRLWNTATGAAWQELHVQAQFIHDIAFSPDGRLLASASQDCTVALWGPATCSEEPGQTSKRKG